MEKTHIKHPQKDLTLKTNRCATRIAVALLLAFIGTGITISAQAEDRLARVFQDNMVLQREKPVPIWGWANPGAQVEVSFGGQKKQAKADGHGYWKAILDPMKANREGQVLTAQIGGISLSCKNVLVGEVWLSAGHSNTIAPGPNMDTGLYPRYDSPGTKGGKPEIRVITIVFGASSEPWDDLDPVSQGDAHWKVMKEDPTADVLNEMEYFARIVRDYLDVPVGILQPLCLGVGQPTWFSRETLEAFPAVTGTGNYYQECFARSDAALSRYGRSWAAFKKAESEWQVTKKGPSPTRGNVELNGYPAVGYNTRIHPLAPYALRGVRMNADATPGSGAAERIVAMVKQWRKLFGQDFYFINITRMRYTNGQQPPLTPYMFTSEQNNAIRESLKLFGGDKREDVVEVGDLGNWLSHYFEKAEAGRRLGLAALNLAYGRKQIATDAGPRMVETKIEGNKATVRFEQVGDGIVYEPSIDGISGVCLLGKTGPSQWGCVKVVGKDTIEVSHPDIAKLETIAYAQNANSHETLFNSAHMPASGFAVNPFHGYDKLPPFEMLSMIGEDKNHRVNNDKIKDAMISLAHVRRSGYVFQIIGKDKVDEFALQQAVKDDDYTKNICGTIPVQAYIPAEWKGFEVVAGDKNDVWFVGGNPASKCLIKAGWEPLKVTETTKNGAKFVTFDAPADRTWVIVAEKGKAAEFRKINRY